KIPTSRRLPRILRRGLLAIVKKKSSKRRRNFLRFLEDIGIYRLSVFIPISSRLRRKLRRRLLAIVKRKSIVSRHRTTYYRLQSRRHRTQPARTASRIRPDTSHQSIGASSTNR